MGLGAWREGHLRLSSVLRLLAHRLSHHTDGGENIITGVGRTVARRDARILAPKTHKHVTFYGKGDFADVIEDPEMAGEPGLSR